MKVIAINGSPRKGWNTHMLLSQALEGASSKGASTTMVNLCDLPATGCASCLMCQRRGAGAGGLCTLQDALLPTLSAIPECDALLLGSPVYFGEVSGMMRCFLQRLLYPRLFCGASCPPPAGRALPTAFVYTTNAPGAAFAQRGYEARMLGRASLLSRLMGSCRTLCVTETLQVQRFFCHEPARAGEEGRLQGRAQLLPEDFRRAFALGADMV